MGLTCADCGKPLPKRNRLYCSTECYHKNKSGSKNPKWRGGNILIGGYRYIYSPEHPNRTKDGYVAEHRLVIEKSIGRLLISHEAVHHINHDPLDNRAENLELCESNGRHTLLHHVKGRDERGRFLYA